MQSESIKELATALAKANMELHNPAFDMKNPHFKNSYASLASVRNAIIPVLATHGLSVVQLPKNDKEGLVLETMLIHLSGEYLSSEFFLPVIKKDAQGYGSALTYARRYALQAIVCVVGDEDDDATVASQKPSNKELEAKYNSFKQELLNCADFESLKNIWLVIYRTGFTTSQLGQLENVKDEVKAEITKQQNEVLNVSQ
jgi:hypothetical protein